MVCLIAPVTNSSDVQDSQKLVSVSSGVCGRRAATATAAAGRGRPPAWGSAAHVSDDCVTPAGHSGRAV
eukprot:4267019-Pyramimonas_sp.AAC.1